MSILLFCVIFTFLCSFVNQPSTSAQHKKSTQLLHLEEIKVTKNESAQALPLEEIKVTKNESAQALPLEEIKVPKSESAQALHVEEIKVTKNESAQALHVEEIKVPKNEEKYLKKAASVITGISNIIVTENLNKTQLEMLAKKMGITLSIKGKKKNISTLRKEIEAARDKIVKIDNKKKTTTTRQVGTSG